MSPALEFPIPDPTSDLHWGEYRGAIHEIFAANARSFPDRPCVEVTRTGGPSLTFTYGQIHAASNRLANYLLARGCELGDVVSIYAYRGVDLVVAYMGALKAGATVSVLDPQYPPERQKVLLDVARPRFLICIRRANEESGPPSAAVMEFIAINLSMKSVIPALELRRDGELRGGGAGSEVDGADCLASAGEDDISSDRVAVGPDSNPTLSFTSGSEGRPKGVLGRHFSLTYYTPWMADRFGLSAADRFTMLSGIAHDPIQRDIFTPLFLGARIVIPPGDVITYEVLAEWMREHSVTVTHLTPAMGQILVGGAATQFPALRLAFFVGDLLTKKDCRKLRDLAPAAAVINLYGSTESQRAVSYFPVPSRDQDPDFLDRLEPDVIPIGQGMLDVQLLVVNRDDRSRLCDVAEQGELFLRAGGLAEGYLERDEAAVELNRTKFLPSWFVDPAKWKEQQPQKRQPGRDGTWKGPRDRLYRTGDLGRMRADGSIECTGRIDLQVKIRGFRIELGEIDVHLSQHPFVRENVTVVRRDKNEEQTLVTYFVPETKRWFEHLEAEERHPRREGREEVETADESMIGMLRRFKTLSEHCRRFLAAKVPTYAVPSIFIPLSRMPLNPNGKVERTALPFPDEADFAALSKRRASSVTPAVMTETQARLAVVWASLLPGRASRTFRPESNFFDEGGHSILAQQLFFRLRREWDLDLPVSAIFQSQTLAALAAEIDRARDPIGLRLDAMPLPGDANVEDEAYAADARDLARHLPESLRSAAAAAGRVTGSGSGLVIFLTGATGFLGSYILRELLDGPAAATRVVAHVRAADADAALARITSTATAYGLWSPAWASRVQAVAGDLARPRLGLSEETWARLAEEVDVVVHNGAHVNWMLPYSSLRPVNVLSTMACIELCTAGARPKRLALVSSTSVLDSAHYVMLSRTGGIVSEDDDLEGSRKGLATGYGQTKWASEFVVREAGRRGLSGAIIRPGYVSGDPGSGICVTDDFLVRLWKGCLQVAGRPDMDHGVNVVPVTQVSRIVAAAALHLSPSGGRPGVAVAQITGHPRLTFNKWIGALETYGYVVPAIPYPEWRDRISAYVTRGGDGDGHGDGDRTAQEEKEEHALLPLFHLVAGDLPTDTVAPELDDTNAAAALRLYMGETASNPLAGSAVSEDTLGSYFANLVATGFLPAPPGGGGGRGVRVLPRLGQEAKALAAGRLGGRSAGR